MAEKRCPDCHGEGTVPYGFDGGGRRRCWTCSGAGWVKEDFIDWPGPEPVEFERIERDYS
jgi:hypothetical protein